MEYHAPDVKNVAYLWNIIICIMYIHYIISVTILSPFYLYYNILPLYYIFHIHYLSRCFPISFFLSFCLFACMAVGLLSLYFSLYLFSAFYTFLYLSLSIHRFLHSLCLSSSMFCIFSLHFHSHNSFLSF